MSDPTTEPQGPVCPVCGGAVASQSGRGQPRRYCSSACKSRAARQRRTDRALSPTPATASAADRWEIAERVRITRALTREVAIEKVAGDPDALNSALLRARTLLAVTHPSGHRVA